MLIKIENINGTSRQSNLSESEIITAAKNGNTEAKKYLLKQNWDTLTPIEKLEKLKEIIL